MIASWIYPTFGCDCPECGEARERDWQEFNQGLNIAFHGYAPPHKMTPGKYIIRRRCPVEYDTRAEAEEKAATFNGGLLDWKVVRVK